MKLLDQLGNEIKLEDWVHFNLPSTSIMATVLQITPGSRLLVRGRLKAGDEVRTTNGMVILRIDVPVVFDPETNQVQGLLKVVKPEGADKPVTPSSLVAN